jgi:putative SOS response-associated peptidase YedK
MIILSRSTKHMKLSLLPPSLTALKLSFGVRNDLSYRLNDLLPGSWLPVLRDAVSGRVELFRWGISEARMGAEDRLVFATKIEDLFTSRGRNLLERRLVVPVESFEMRCEGRAYRIRSADLKPLALAAVWDVDGHWRSRPVRAFRLITGPTIDGCSRLGPRMPIILRSDNRRAWLWHFTEETAALDALEPYTELEID